MMMDPAGIKWHERQEEKPARQTYPLPNHAHATHGSLLISLPHPSHNAAAALPLLQDSVGTPAHIARDWDLRWNSEKCKVHRIAYWSIAFLFAVEAF